MCRILVLLTFFTPFLFSQESQLTAKQRKLVSKLGQSVAAPCCSNMIPVAFHESQWAFDIRDFIEERVVAGDSERAIFDQLAKLEFGSERKNVTFTVPDRDGLGYLAWMSPIILIGLGIFAVFIFRRLKRHDKLSDDDLIASYGPIIKAQLDLPS